MSRVLLATAFCLFALTAEGKLISKLLNHQSDNETSSESQQSKPETTTETQEDEVCFDYIGCFDMGEPWHSLLRPIPAPIGPGKQPIRLLFYSRPDVNEHYTIVTYPKVNLGGAPFDPSKPTVVITHGFTNNGSSTWMHDLKDVYLRKVDANVMLVDWGPGAQKQNYLQVTGNTRVVGRVVARVLQTLMHHFDFPPSRIHLIGHSLGAQISSYIGKEIRGIGRLTALDPAQPGFESYDKIVRLDKSDADYVDVIHTDAKPFIPTLGFGMVKPHGHVDFYVNGGFEQPGCIVPEDIPKINNLLDLGKFPIELFSEIKQCNHGRAHQYLIESFNETENCIFWGHKASAPEVAKSVIHSLTQAVLPQYTALSSTCTKENCVPLGFGSKLSPLRGVFLVTTNRESPYCIREKGVSPEEVMCAESSASSLKSMLVFARVAKFGEHLMRLLPFS